MSDTNKHALLSPSGAAGWMVCAGKPAMERGLPDKSSDDSEYGTAAHTLASMCLVEQKDPAAYLGRYLDAGPCKTIEVDDEMADGVRVYVHQMRDLITEYKQEGAVSVEMLVEQRVPIGHITGEEGAEGTADAIFIVLWADGTAMLDVRDLKFGVGIKVTAEKNPQLMLYLLGAVEKFSAVTDFHRVRVGIHQPRVSETPSEWEMAIEDLRFFKTQAQERAFHAMQVYKNEPPEALIHHLTAGDHCKKTFCKARAICPKLASFVVDTVGAEFEELAQVETPAADNGMTVADLILKSTTGTPASIATKFKAITIIEDWCKAVRAKAEALLFEHKNSPEIIQELGIKLVKGKKGNRAWVGEKEAEAEMKAMRLKQDEMYEFKLISPTTAEELLKSNPKRWKRLEGLITQKDGQPSVTEADDKRPAYVMPNLIDEFEVIETIENVEDLV